MSTTQFWFCRHGEVETHQIGAFVGSTEVGLSDLGAHQAEAIAAYLEDSPIDAILTSPRARAQRTAAPLAQRLGLRPIIRDDLTEMHFGEWEGLFWDEIQAKDPEFAKHWAEDPHNRAMPGGVTTKEFQSRIHEELATILEEFRGNTLAIFAHAGVNRAILSHQLEQPYLEMFRFAQDYGCINAGAVAGDQRQVAMVNLVPGPRSSHNGDGGRSIDE